MFKYVVLLLMLGSVFANTLSEKQESIVLTSIDNICGDTWCEGDFNFDFYSLECSAETNSCTLEADLIEYTYSGDDYSDEKEIRYPSKCTIEGYSSFDSMLEDKDTRWPDLAWDFYEAVTDCVTTMEEAVYESQK